MLAPRDAAGGGYERVLPRNARRAGALRLARPVAPRQPVEAAKAVAGVAPRPRMTPGAPLPGRVHVIGAGLAGLAAAVAAAARGHPVVLYESGAHAGGR